MCIRDSASAPPRSTIAGRLARAVTRIEKRPAPFTLTPPAAEILLRALHALPRRRYADAKAMAEELDELLARLDGCLLYTSRWLPLRVLTPRPTNPVK